MEHVSKTLSTFVQTKLETTPDGVDVKDVSYYLGENRLAFTNITIYFGQQLAIRFTLDVIANTIFGIDGKSLSENKSHVFEMGTNMFDTSKSVIFYQTLVHFMPMIERFWKMSLIPKHAERYFEKLTQDAVQMRSDHNVTREDFLSFLIQLREKKNLKEIDMVGHAMTFFLEGYETSSTVIANIINQLARNPMVQGRLRSEINNAFASKSSISFEDILDIEYLDQVLCGI